MAVLLHSIRSSAYGRAEHQRYVSLCEAGDPRGTASWWCRLVGVRQGLSKTNGSQSSSEVEYAGARLVSSNGDWAARSSRGNILHLLQGM